MSKRWEREEKIIERLNNENKKLRLENRHLLKKLKQANKGYYKFLTSDTENHGVDEIIKVAIKICYDCSIGNYKEIIVANRR